MEYSIESILVIAAAYIIGMGVTSIISKRDKGIRTMLDAYESILVDLTARLDVLDARLSLINVSHDITGLHATSRVEDTSKDGIKEDGSDNSIKYDASKDSSEDKDHADTMPILMQRGNTGNGIKDNGVIKEILALLSDGPKTSREIERAIGRSREHTARLMKRLYDAGYVKRDESAKPYRYTLV